MKTTLSAAFLAILLLVITNLSFASNNPTSYEQLWEEVNAAVDKSLPKTALQVLDLVHEKALTEKNDPQLLKSILFRFKLYEMTEEDHLQLSINYAHSQLNLLESPSKQWLHSILAELYVFYYQQHRYEWLERNTVVDNDSDDLNEWDLGKLQAVIQTQYEQSVDDMAVLKYNHLTAYKDILENTEEVSLTMQPTVYDFLVQRLIAYYLSSDAGIVKPVAGNPFTEPKAWAEGAVFVKLKLADSENPSVKALQLIQQLMQFHINDKNPDAYFHCDLQRLEHVRNIFTKQSDSDTKYLKALETLQQTYNRQAISTEAAALRARYLLDQPTTGVSIHDSATSWNSAKAMAICEDAIANFPESRGAKSCLVLKQQILEKAINLSVQDVELPNKPIALYVGYQNITRIAFRLIKTTQAELESLLNVNDQKARNEALLKLKPTHNWQVEIPFEADYHKHSTILNLPPLEGGIYVLLASFNNDFTSGGLVTFIHFQVSHLSFIHNKTKNTNIFFVLDRETGKPVKNAQVTIQSRIYDYVNRNYKTEIIGKFMVGKNGKIEIKKDEITGSRAFYIEIETAKDKLYSDNYFDNYYPKPEQTKHLQTFLFTDRAIYRPGQIVFFKGILLEQDDKESNIKVNQLEEIKFYDANNQLINTIKRTTNDFGSFEGSFTIPTGILNGNMRLSTEHGSININVEEYKRPTFEVTLESPNAQFALDEMVTLNGNAVAYAGFGLDSVSFSYKVERGQQFPYWRSCWGWPPFGAEKTLIANGASFTNNDGSFTVDFKLVPDENTNNRFNPVFVYTLTVDVTDRNGETRTGTKTLYASSNALIISTNIEDEIDKSEIGNYQLTTTNLQGKVVKTTLNESIFVLYPESDIERPMILQQPDRQLLTNDELKLYFPLDNFYKQTDPEKRLKKLIFKGFIRVDSAANIFPQEATDWEQGTYYVELSAHDKFGKEVKFIKEFTLFDEQSKEIPGKSLAWSSVSKITAEAADTLEFQFGSAAQNNFVLVELSAGIRIIQRNWLRVSHEKIKIPYLVQADDRGKLRCTFTYIRYNRLMNSVLDVDIPFTNTILDLQLETKRDRLTPGMKDTWTVSVKSKNNAQVRSELMAALYDASLDAFVLHNWYFSLLSYRPFLSPWSADQGFSVGNSLGLFSRDVTDFFPQPILNPSLNWFGLSQFSRNYTRPFLMADGAKMEGKATLTVMNDTDNLVRSDETLKEKTNPEKLIIQEDTKSLRTNFNETAFFFPQLKTDTAGMVTFSFQLPYALTKWKLLLLAHTKDLKTGTAEFMFNASKDVMIMPNLPRFYREGDTAYVQAKIVNTSKNPINGTAFLEISDALTGQMLTAYLAENQTQPFETVEPGKSKNIRWKIAIGKETNLIEMKFSATAGTFTDSEQHQIPVLPQKTLITESLVLNTQANTTRLFSFKPLNDKDVKQIERIEIQVCSNPSWYAIQALPYLVNDDFNNAESIFNHFYANTLASIIAQNIPEAIKVIDQWKTLNPNELLSNFEKNQQLKSVLLHETPWVMAAKDENDQKNRIAVLFDINRMQYERTTTMKQLKQLQTANGAWTWFPGMPESAYITNRIMAGLGKLIKLQADFSNQNNINAMVYPAIDYLDQNVTRSYEKLVSEKKTSDYTLWTEHLNYLYTRSFFTDKALKEPTKPAFDFILKHLETDWKTFDKGMQAMAAVALQRFGRQEAAKAILASLREHAILNPELGMYWKNTFASQWYEAPIESQALIIQAFEEIEGKSPDLDQMRTWLLSQKQTNCWRTTSGTAEAIYALLLRGTDWIGNNKSVEMKVGNQVIDQPTHQSSPIFTKVYTTSEINSNMIEIEIHNPNPSMSWGGAFRQYFMDIDKVTASKTPLELTEELYIERIGKNGKELVSINNQPIGIGDKVIVRIVLTVDRAMEFVHLKDQRAASFEPVNVISGYTYKGGLGFYQTTKDASTDFFFDRLPKGKYVFEYELIASQSGEFSNGRALIECYYAPEFLSHSGGMRVKVVN